MLRNTMFLNRLCSFLVIYLNSLSLSFVLSSNINTNSNSKDTGFIISEEDTGLVLSLGNISSHMRNNYEPFADPIIEYMSEVPPLKTTSLSITDVPKDIYYMIVELHSYVHEITLGYRPDKKDPHSYVTGTNIGLVSITDIKGFSGAVTLYIENPNAFNVTVLVAVTAYSKSAPIPGGCNMEFNTEIAPYLHLNYTNSLITVLSQPASLPPSSVTTERIGCQILPDTLIHYDLYHMYLPERDFSEDTYFNSIKSMLTVDRIKQYGTKVPPSLTGPINKRLFSSYIGTGSVFAIIVYTSSGVNDNDDYIVMKSAAYVPILTYGCTPTHYLNGCQVFTSAMSGLIFFTLCVLGLFVNFLGHSFFKTSMFLYGAFTCGIITNIILVVGNVTAFPSPTLLASLTGGLVWLQIWRYCGFPIVSILLPLLNMGVLASATIIHFFSGWYALQPVIQSDANYWLSIVCGSLSIMLLLVTRAQDASILANAFIGGYIALIPVDQYFGSNIKYIIVNLYRRATIEEFDKAMIDPPFQGKDLFLMLAWFVVCTNGYIFQKTLVADRPPFPPPTHDRSRSHDYQHNRHSTSCIKRFMNKIINFVIGTPSAEMGFFDNRTAEETTPILSHSNTSSQYTSPISNRSDSVFLPSPNI